MLLTTTTLLLFFAAAVLVLGVGIFSERNEAYFLGAIMLFFLGLMVMQNGVSEKVGQNETVVGNTTAIVYNYEEMNETWQNGLGLLFILSGAGLALHFYRARKERREKEANSIDLDE